MLFPLISFLSAQTIISFVMQLSHLSASAFGPKPPGGCFWTNALRFRTAPPESGTSSPRRITLNYGELRQITPFLIHDVPSLAQRCCMRVNPTKSDQIRLNPSNFLLGRLRLPRAVAPDCTTLHHVAPILSGCAMLAGPIRPSRSTTPSLYSACPGSAPFPDCRRRPEGYGKVQKPTVGNGRIELALER